MTTRNILKDNAVLVRLNIRKWTGEMLDRRITEEVAEANEAQSGMSAGRYTKKLVSKERIKRVANVDGSIRTIHAQETLPWMQDGVALLPIKNWHRYMEKMNEKRREWEDAVQEFLDGLAEEKMLAKLRLGKMYREEEFPTASALRGRFVFSVQVFPVPDSSHFVGALLSPQDMAEAQESLEQAVKDATQEAVREMWERACRPITRMIDRLSGPERIFRDSLVENVAEMVDAIQRMNITNDPKLKEMAEQMQTRLLKYTPETLRSDPAVRSEMATEAQKVYDQFKGIY